MLVRAAMLLCAALPAVAFTSCPQGSFWSTPGPFDFQAYTWPVTFSASSWNSTPGCNLPTINTAGSWCADVPLDSNTKISMTLPDTTYVYGIAIQGRNNQPEWVTSAELFYRLPTGGYTSAGVLARSSNDQTTVTYFNTYFVAQIMYLLVRGVNNWPSMRIAAYVAPGTSCAPCPAGTYSSIVDATGCVPCPAGTYSSANASACTACATTTIGGGYAKVLLPSLFIASQWDNSSVCQSPTLYSSGAWCPGLAASGSAVSPHFLILDAGGVANITHIATQGLAGSGKYVKGFTVKYANSATTSSSWTSYSGTGLAFNTDDSGVVTSTLNPPISARFIKLQITSASVPGVAMRAGIFSTSGAQGCSASSPVC